MANEINSMMSIADAASRGGYDYVQYYDNATAPDELAHCTCCQRRVPRKMVKATTCSECFIEWYDGDRPTAKDDAGNYDERKMYSKAYIGGWIRQKHGLPPLPLPEAP